MVLKTIVTDPERFYADPDPTLNVDADPSDFTLTKSSTFPPKIVQNWLFNSKNYLIDHEVEGMRGKEGERSGERGVMRKER